MRFLILAILALTSFLTLVSYNFFQAQKALREEKPSIFQIESLSSPNSITLGSPASFTWKVNVPAGLTTPFTTLYWGYESSPSALIENDSPQAVGYLHPPSDYEKGEFPLPLTFDVSIVPDRPGQVFFRSYALVQGKHLWSPELSFIVTNGQ